MADTNININLTSKFEGGDKGKPQSGSGVGQGAGGGSPDSSQSQQPIKAKPVSDFELREKLVEHYRKKGIDPSRVDKLSQGQLESLGQKIFPTAEPIDGGKGFTRVGSMSDIGETAKETDARNARRKRLLNKRRKAQRARELRHTAQENALRKLHAKQREQEALKQEKAQAKLRRDQEKAHKQNVMRGTKSQNIAAGATRQLGTAAGGGRIGATIGAIQNASKIFGPMAGPVAVAVGSLGAAAGVSVLALRQLKNTVKEVDESLQNIAKSIAPFSPQVSVALARQDLMRMQTQMRRSQTISNDMSKFIQGRTVVEAQLEDIKTSLLNRFLPLLNENMPQIQSIVQLLGRTAESFADFPWETVIDALNFVANMEKDKWDFTIKVQNKLNELNKNALEMLGLYKNKLTDDELKEDAEQMHRNLARFLGITAPERAFDFIEKENDGAPGSLKNVPDAGLFNPLG